MRSAKNKQLKIKKKQPTFLSRLFSFKRSYVLGIANCKLINLRKKPVGDSVSILTEIDEYLAEEVFVVAANLVIGDLGHNAFIF